ncbi:hypothetical protein CEXT_102541 [Caerostris extrusa]|uniref:Uncharacterized protein n=1 Tax=Caerostris extrusa TaxID=172846 RepID=A0AAV4TV70_CAEEX|nr:hypothetical protein CEXT_102541 [Caerostris extrusa]
MPAPYPIPIPTPAPYPMAAPCPMAGGGNSHWSCMSNNCGCWGDVVDDWGEGSGVGLAMRAAAGALAAVPGSLVLTVARNPCPSAT